MKTHKSCASQIGVLFRNGEYRDDKDGLIALYNSSGKELCKRKYDSCVKCFKKEDLTFHHIITRLYANLLPLDVYFTQRNYWANIIILCKQCHASIHKLPVKVLKGFDDAGK